MPEQCVEFSSPYLLRFPTPLFLRPAPPLFAIILCPFLLKNSISLFVPLFWTSLSVLTFLLSKSDATSWARSFFFFLNPIFLKYCANYLFSVPSHFSGSRCYLSVTSRVRLLSFTVSMSSPISVSSFQYISINSGKVSLLSPSVCLSFRT